MAHTASYRWRHIEDLGPDDVRLTGMELESLSQVWKEQYEQLGHSEGLKRFNEQLKRKWAIETGVIERVYDLDRGTTQILIERGIDASLIPAGATNRPPDLVVAMIRDHEVAMEGMFDFVGGQRLLSTAYIKELHAVLTRNQQTCTVVDSLGSLFEAPLLRGTWKKFPNNPVRRDGFIHEYTPPECVASEMDRLVELFRNHERRGIPPQVEAAWLHHRFSQIHPFQDGNGRVARCLANLVFIQAGWFPLVVTRDDRESYIEALEQADRGDLRALVPLFERFQKKAFVEALDVAASILERNKIHDVIKGEGEILRERREALAQEWNEVKAVASQLQNRCRKRLEEIEDQIRHEISEITSEFRCFVDDGPDESERRHDFREEVIQAARKLDYYANFRHHHGWVRLVVRTTLQADILFSFHGIGHEFRGVLACSACFFRRAITEARDTAGSEEREIAGLSPCQDYFQFNYKETPENAAKRFEDWLDESLRSALELWRRSP